MEMQMRHGLLARLSDVGYHAITGTGKAHFLGQLGNNGKNMAHHRRALFCHSGNGLDMSLRHHQEMGGRLGINVIKGVT